MSDCRVAMDVCIGSVHASFCMGYVAMVVVVGVRVLCSSLSFGSSGG